MSKLYTFLDKKRKGKNEHDTKDGKLHIFKVREENRKYYAEGKCLCGDIVLEKKTCIEFEKVFKEIERKAIYLSNEDIKYDIPDDTCEKCEGFCK